MSSSTAVSLARRHIADSRVDSRTQPIGRGILDILADIGGDAAIGQVLDVHLQIPVAQSDAGGQVDRGVVTGFGRDGVIPNPTWIVTQKRWDVAPARVPGDALPLVRFQYDNDVPGPAGYVWIGAGMNRPRGT
jgi:hypothetical protein